MVQQNRSRYTVRGYLADCREFFLWFTSNPLTVTRENLDAYLQVLREKPGRNGQKMSPKSINKKVNGIAAYFRFLLYKGSNKTNPVDGLRRPESKRSLPKIIPLADVRAMLNAPAVGYAQRVDRLIVNLFFSTGARLGDLEQARLVDYNPTEGTLHTVGKGGKEAYMMIGDGAKALLDAYLLERKSPLPNLLVKEDGTLWPRNQIYLAVKRLAKRAGVTKSVHPHAFRHTAATELYKNSHDIKMVQEFLRHSSSATTDIYTHVSTDQLKAAHHKFHPDNFAPKEMDKSDPDGGKA